MNHIPHRNRSIRKAGLAAAAFMGLATLLQAGTLVENSPFIPPESEKAGGPPPVTNPQAQNLAFRGVYAIAGKHFYNIFNKQQNKGVWISDGDPTSEYPVISYNESNNSVRLKVDGKEQDYALDRPTWVSVPVQGAPPPVVAGPQPQPGRGMPNRPPPPRRRVISPNMPPPAPPGTQAYNAWANMPANIRPPTPPPSSPPMSGPPSTKPVLPDNIRQMMQNGQIPPVPTSLPSASGR